MSLQQLLERWLVRHPNDACDPDLTFNVRAGLVQTGPDCFVEWEQYSYMRGAK